MESIPENMRFRASDYESLKFQSFLFSFWISGLGFGVWSLEFGFGFHMDQQ
jgi:hypothetical protein